MKRTISIMWGVAVLTGCGQDNGYLYNQKLVQVDAPLQQREAFATPDVSFTEATWFMPCDSNSIAPTAAAGAIVLSNTTTPNTSYRRQFTNTPIEFAGDICPAKVYPRDVVILVDVSSGVGFPDSDPLVNGGCKRLTAVEALVNSLGAGAQVKVATFDENVLAASTAWFTNVANLEKDLTGGTPANIANVLCAATGSPYNDVGLTEAKTMLATGRGITNANEELYLMTDGDPAFLPTDPNYQLHHVTGDAILAQIRASGVTVGGMYTAGPTVDTWLPQVVSNDQTGAKIADDIANVLSVGTRVGGYAINNIVTATVNYRIQGAAAWTPENVLPSMTLPTGAFSINVAPFTIDRTQTGWEAELTYVDSHGNAHTQTSELNWLDD